jgi:hypothetical protein
VTARELLAAERQPRHVELRDDRQCLHPVAFAKVAEPRRDLAVQWLSGLRELASFVRRLYN